MAREKALANLRLVQEGKEPYVEKHRPTEPTFAEAVPIVVEIHKKRWKKKRTQDKHAADWVSSLKRYAYPAFGHKHVSKIAPRDILDVLEPLWTVKSRTAEAASAPNWGGPALGHAAGLPSRRSYWSGARWHARERQSGPSTSKHCRPPRLVQPLRWIRASEGWPFTKLLLEFPILTAARPQEARLAQWSEIDFATATWTKPAEHTKTKEGHDVPLSAAALAVLALALELAGGRKRGAHLPFKEGRCELQRCPFVCYQAALHQLRSARVPNELSRLVRADSALTSISPSSAWATRWATAHRNPTTARSCWSFVARLCRRGPIRYFCVDR